MADYALLFDGIQNYVSLSTLGNLGSNLGSGFYCKFDIKTTSSNANISPWGVANGTNNRVYLTLNNSANQIRIDILDNAGLKLSAVCTKNIIDGNKHTLIVTATMSTNIVTISVDGVAQSISYINQQTPTTFVNFTANFALGARTVGASLFNYCTCTLDNFQIGINAGNLYGIYNFDEGSGTTTADSSGNGNTGTLLGSPVPRWVTGLNAYGNVIGNFTFSGNLGFNSQ